jgi:hypothetical protein
LFEEQAGFLISSFYSVMSWRLTFASYLRFLLTLEQARPAMSAM